jgi:alpha-aminoadipate carrier protein LysW
MEEVEMAICLECAAELDLGPDTVVAEIVVCPDCGVELEVMSIDPIEVDLAPEVEEDWGE